MGYDFETFWLSGPWLKLGKKAAQRHFSATVKTPEDWQHINVARDAYSAHLKRYEWKHPQHGSTWFNNWHDYYYLSLQQSVPERSLEERAAVVRRENEAKGIRYR